MSDVQAQLATALADRYRIERELGQGGMATVYLAEDLRHQRPVALKVPRPLLGSPSSGKLASCRRSAGSSAREVLRPIPPLE